MLLFIYAEPHQKTCWSENGLKVYYPQCFTPDCPNDTQQTLHSTSRQILQLTDTLFLNNMLMWIHRTALSCCCCWCSCEPKSQLSVHVLHCHSEQGIQCMMEYSLHNIYFVYTCAAKTASNTSSAPVTIKRRQLTEKIGE